MLDAKEIEDIINSITSGVDMAREAGVRCGYPDSVTVESVHNGKPISATYPIGIASMVIVDE